jgi:hypothetical protein
MWLGGIKAWKTILDLLMLMAAVLRCVNEVDVPSFSSSPSESTEKFSGDSEIGILSSRDTARISNNILGYDTVDFSS